ncbi:MAG: polysaccharide deacetylase family protein [Bacteriovoracia bacterium]
MKFLLFFLFLSFPVFSSVWELEHYPEDRTYTSQDRGMRPYRALSLYKTGSFALTFDDGPHPVRTPAILDILKKHGVKATFFVLTDLLNEKNFHLIKRILDEGHILASHGPSHDRSGSLTKEEWKQQTKKSFLDLARWYKRAGHEFKKHYYRFPYGDYGTREDYHHINALKEVSQELMGDNCIHMAFWDVDTSDWVPGMTPEEVAQNIIAFNEGGTYIGFKKEGSGYVKVPMIVKNPTSGGVILQHDVQEPSVKGLDLFLSYAQERGVRIVPLNEVEEFSITKTCQL